MSGSPVRPSRSAYGPDPVNRRGPVSDPEGELGADVGRLMLWQLAGLGLVAPRAVCLLEDNGTRLASAESWNPRGLLPNPVTAQTAPGTYKITYPSTAPDENGTPVPIVLLGAHATPQKAAAVSASCDIDASGLIVTVFVFDSSTGAPSDRRVLVSVF